MKTSNNNMLDGTNHKVNGLHLILELNHYEKSLEIFWCKCIDLKAPGITKIINLSGEIKLMEIMLDQTT